MSVNIKGMKKYHRSDKPEKKSLKCKIGIDESLFSLGVNGGKKIGGGGGGYLTHRKKGQKQH